MRQYMFAEWMNEWMNLFLVQPWRKINEPKNIMIGMLAFGDECCFKLECVYILVSFISIIFIEV